MEKERSISKIFSKIKEAFTPKPLTLDDLVDKAEWKADDINDMLHDVRDMEREFKSYDENHPGIFGKARAELSVENVKGYLEYINDNALDLATELKREAKEQVQENAQIHQKLSQSLNTFEKGSRVFLNFIKRHGGVNEMPPVEMSLKLFSNAVKRFEPDTRPLAPVVPIRQEFDIEG